MSKYPNLQQAALYFNFAYFANITPGLLQEIIAGNEELTAVEAFNMAHYTQIPYKVLFNSKLILLDKDRLKHQRMMDELMVKLRAIKAWEKKGSHEAETYMKYQRISFVNLYTDFFFGHPVAYTRYLGVKHRMDDTLLFIRCEQDKIHNKPRDVKQAIV